MSERHSNPPNSEGPRRGPGKQFGPGNSGRKPGSKNRATLFAASLLTGEAEHLLRKAIELAKTGDKDMLKFLLNRILPKERTIRLSLPMLEHANDAVTSIARVTRALAEGELTPSEVAAISTFIGNASSSILVRELDEKIDRLDKETCEALELVDFARKRDG